MPELPEVEVIKRELTPHLCGKTFAAPIIHYQQAIRYPDAQTFSRRLEGRSVQGLERKGKYLRFELNRGTLLAHLRMTGKLIYRSAGSAAKNPTAPARDLRVKLPLTGGGALYFYDMRKFGGFWLLEKQDYHPPKGYLLLGPDIWKEVDEDRFLSLLQARPRARIKPLLLDQCFVAGMGNIYTDESLFRSRIHPCRRVASLSEEEGRKLFQEIRSVLADGIACGGTTTRDYRNIYGGSGSFQKLLEVYSRKGEPCPRCGETVERTVVAGRGTYFCPCCQVLNSPAGGDRKS